MTGPFSSGLLNRLPSAPEKVVIVHALRIGDFICATPAFRALRRALPEAEITLIGLPFVEDLVSRSPHLDRFIEFPGYPGMAEQFFDARRAAEFFAQMQAEQFDLALQMTGSGVYSNPFTLMLGARVTAGFVRPGDGAGRLDAALPMPRNGHQVDRMLALARFLGAAPQGRDTEFPLLNEDRHWADAVLSGVPTPLIGLHPDAREAGKRWPPARFAALACRLRDRFGGTVVLLGGPDSCHIASEVGRLVGGRCLDLSARLPIAASGAVIARISLLVTNDSGPAHIAYGLGTPSVTIFAGTDPGEWGPPLEGPHRVVSSPAWPTPGFLDDGAPVPSRSGVEGIPVEDVAHAAEELLAGATALRIAGEQPAVSSYFWQ